MSETGTAMDVLSAEAEDARNEDAFIVDTEGYEGPLHMLLDMARRQKVDLLQVSILDLAKQYLACVFCCPSRKKTKRVSYPVKIWPRAWRFA